MSFVDRVVTWNLAAGNTDDSFNVRQAAMYIGLQLEEMAEKLDAMASPAEGCSGFVSPVLGGMVSRLHDLSHEFKAGNFDAHVERADRTALLDADCDIAVVTVGAMMSIGADIHGSLDEVCTSNESKAVPHDACGGSGRLTELDKQGFAIGDSPCDECNSRGWILQKDETGKIQKGAHYQAPQLAQFLAGKP